MAVVNGRIEPDFAHMERTWRDCMRNMLTDIQAAKLCYAMLNYYLDGEEPTLPKPAMLMFDAMRGNLDYRRKKSIEQLRKRSGGAPSIVEDSREHGEVPDGGLEEVCEVSDISLEETCEDSDRYLEDESPSTREYDESTSQWPGGQREAYSHSHIHNQKQTSLGLGPGLGSGFDGGGRTRTPTLDEVRTYCEACGLAVSPENFFNFFEANGWRDRDGSPVRDWRAVLRAWNQREGHYPAKAQAADVGNGGDERKRLKIGCITSAGKTLGEWFIQSPVEYAGPIPGSGGMSKDEAMRLAVELHPDLSTATEK